MFSPSLQGRDGVGPLLNFIIKRLAADAQKVGSLLHISVAFVQDLAHMFCFQLVQGYYFASLVDGILQHTDKFVVVPRLGYKVGCAVL